MKKLSQLYFSITLLILSAGSANAALANGSPYAGANNAAQLVSISRTTGYADDKFHVAHLATRVRINWQANNPLTRQFQRINSWIPQAIRPTWQFVDITVGKVEAGAHSALFMSVGPSASHTVDVAGIKFGVEAGIAPSYIGKIGEDRDLGGRFHFTSHAALRFPIDKLLRNSTLLVRAQHSSNAGTRDANPGLDIFGVELEYRP